MVAVYQCAGCLGWDRGGKEEEAGGDQLWGASLGALRSESASGEQPHDDEAGERLDEKETFIALAQKDVSDAGDLMLPVWEAPGGKDG